MPVDYVGGREEDEGHARRHDDGYAAPPRRGLFVRAALIWNVEQLALQRHFARGVSERGTNRQSERGQQDDEQVHGGIQSNPAASAARPRYSCNARSVLCRPEELGTQSPSFSAVASSTSCPVGAA